MIRKFLSIDVGLTNLAVLEVDVICLEDPENKNFINSVQIFMNLSAFKEEKAALEVLQNHDGVIYTWEILKQHISAN